MNKLISFTAIVVIAGSAQAANPFDGISGAELYAQENAIKSKVETIGSQPEIGMVQNSVNYGFQNQGEFWNLNGELLDRNHNPQK